MLRVHIGQISSPMCIRACEVRSWHKTDILGAAAEVRYRG
jgi:hypothetical protein